MRSLVVPEGFISFLLIRPFLPLKWPTYCARVNSTSQKLDWEELLVITSWNSGFGSSQASQCIPAPWVRAFTAHLSSPFVSHITFDIRQLQYSKCANEQPLSDRTGQIVTGWCLCWGPEGVEVWHGDAQSWKNEASVLEFRLNVFKHFDCLLSTQWWLQPCSLSNPRCLRSNGFTGNFGTLTSDEI